MPKPTAAVLAAGPALQALHGALGRTPPPCTDDDRWTSESRTDVRHAVTGCQPCPARPECRSYGRAIEASCGVWGGVQLRPRSTTSTRTKTNDTTDKEMTA